MAHQHLWLDYRVDLFDKGVDVVALRVDDEDVFDAVSVFLDHLDEIIERFASCPLLPRGFDDAISDLNEGFDREHRAQKRAGRADSPSLS